MKKYNICIHDNFGNISFDENFKAKNATEALREALDVIDVKTSDIIRTTEEE